MKRRFMNNSEDKLPKNRVPAIRVLAMPKDANPTGDIFGGWIISHADTAGAVAAMKRSSGRVATVAVNNFEFKKPVFVGDLLSCYTEILKVGRTSMTIKVTAYAERDSREKCVIKVTEATIVYVALDKNRKPRPVDN